jgi:hypothetical protein
VAVEAHCRIVGDRDFIAQGQLASNLGYLAAAFFSLERLPNG